MKVTFNFQDWFNTLGKRYRVISRDSYFLAQTRGGWSQSWENIYIHNYKDGVTDGLVLDNDLVTHSSVSEAWDTLKSRKLYEEIEVLRDKKNRVIGYL